MKKHKKLSISVVILFASIFAAKTSLAAGPTTIQYSLYGDNIWTKEGSPYVIKNNVDVYGPLTIEPGVIVKFEYKKGASLSIHNRFTAVGTKDEKIIFTSIRDDAFGGDTNGDGDATKAAPGDWSDIRISSSLSGIMENCGIYYGEPASLFSGAVAISGMKDFILRNSEIKYNQGIGIMITYDAKPVIENNIISNNGTGIFLWPKSPYGKDMTVVRRNSIKDNIYGAKVYSSITTDYRLDARDNWWGSATGPKFKHISYGEDNLTGLGNPVTDRVLFDPWLGKDPTIEDPGCQENCYSNVMFLPGIKASRLYMDGIYGSEDQLWPPNYFGNDLTNLALYKDGKSVNNVFTKDAVDEVGITLVGGNIYKTFLGKLSDLKSDGTINDYETFAYDWRQNVEDIAKNGTPYPEDIIKSAVADLGALAESSKSKKVTIIAHSNGGLLAKAIMQELESKGLTDQVDKIVLIGTPQMGTPLAMLSLLYGYDEAALFGTLISRSESRSLAENMPGAYGLLPSGKYFERMEEPFVSFSSQNTGYKIFSDAYGENINSLGEFKNFLLGKIDGRAKPESNEVEKENILNENLVSQAVQTHERLDDWTPPEGVQVIQIAGWGLDTVSGVEYTEKEKTDCYETSSKIPSCIGIGEYEPVYDPKFTVDGDKVVVTPSALMLADAPNVNKYWVDLYRSNKFFTIGREHKDILEFGPMEEFIYKIITNDDLSSSVPDYIHTFRPADYNNAKPRLRMSLYSPLDIHLYDDAGRHTGPKVVNIGGEYRTIFEEGIPDSYYYQFGDRKYVGFAEGENIRVVMKGYATGTYTLKLEEVKTDENGEEIAAHTTFSDLPTTADATVSLGIPATGLADMTPLEADMDSDGASDYSIDKSLNGTAVLPVTIETIADDVDHLAKLGFITDSKTQDFLQVKIRELAHDKDMIEKMDGKGNKNPEGNQVRLLNKKIDDLVGFIEEKFSETILSLAKDLLIKDLNSVKI